MKNFVFVTIYSVVSFFTVTENIRVVIFIRESGNFKNGNSWFQPFEKDNTIQIAAAKFCTVIWTVYTPDKDKRKKGETSDSFHEKSTVERSSLGKPI